MKIENEKLKLQKRDKRFGNFVVTSENEHYKIQTINQNWSLRVEKNTIMGKLIKEGLSFEEGGFQNIIDYLYYISSSVIDITAIPLVLSAYNASGLRVAIQSKKAVMIYGSEKEMADKALNALLALNIFLNDEEKASLSNLLTENFNSNKEIYSPECLSDDTADIKDMKAIEEGLENLKQE